MECPANQIFTRALELPEAARTRFVDEACADDSNLRREVEQLLMDAIRADEFFGESGNGVVPEDGSTADDGEPPASGRS